MSELQDLAALIRANTPLIVVETPDEPRVVELFRQSLQQVWRALSGVTITEGLLNRVEVAIRAYDPCLSCATHALGQMPLIVQLVDCDGHVLDRKVRGEGLSDS